MAKPDTTYRVTYTDRIVRDAVKTFVWRRGVVGQKGLWFAEFVLGVMFIWLLARGEHGWGVGLLGATLLAPPSLIAAVWIAHYRNTVGKFRSMRSPVADITLGADALSIGSELGTAQIPWSGLTEVWDRPTYWMVFTAPGQFFTLPIEAISHEDRDLLRANIGRSPTDRV